MRLVEAEHLDDASSESQMIREILPYIFELSLHLSWAMPTSLPVLIVYMKHFITLYNHETCISYLSSIENPPNVHLGNFRRHWKWPPLNAYLWGLQYLKGKKCNFRDNGELIQCCIWTIDSGREVGMAQFRCKPRSNIRQVFPIYFMNLWSETRKRRQSSTSLGETTI